MDVRRRKESLARLRDRVAQWEASSEGHGLRCFSLLAYSATPSASRGPPSSQKHQDEARQAARDALEVACRLSQLRVEQVLPTVIGPMRRCLGAHMLVPQSEAALCMRSASTDSCNASGMCDAPRP